MKKLFSLVMAAMLAAGLLVPAAGAVTPAPQTSISVQAGHAYLYNLTEDEVLYDQLGNEKAYPASMTKVATILMALEALDRGEITLDQVVLTKDEDWYDIVAGSSSAGLYNREEVTIEYLLYGLMLPSGNDAANVVARVLGGSVEGFVKQVNARAAELGCTGTHFVNPHGLHDDNHYTTAHDICILFKEALKHPLFEQIISTESYTTPATNKKDPIVLHTTNALISSHRYGSGYLYENCIGGKTGSTNEAKLCLVALAEKDGTRLISVVMGASSVYINGYTERMQFTETRRLMEWGFANFSVQQVLGQNTQFATLPVRFSEDGESVAVVAQTALSHLLPVDMDLDALHTEMTLTEEELDAPVAAGTVVGSVSVLDAQGNLYGKTQLVLAEDLSLSKRLYWKWRIGVFFHSKAGITLLVVVGIILLLVLRVLQVALRRRARRRRRARQRARQRGSR